MMHASLRPAVAAVLFALAAVGCSDNSVGDPGNPEAIAACRALIDGGCEVVAGCDLADLDSCILAAEQGLPVRTCAAADEITAAEDLDPCLTGLAALDCADVAARLDAEELYRDCSVEIVFDR